MKKDKPFGELFYRSLKKTLLIMRIAIVLLIIGVLQAQANDAYSQKTRLSLNFSETELVKVLDKIEQESEFFFLYNEKLLDTERKVSITERDQLIDVILNNLFSGTDVKYTIIDRKIILAPDYLTEVSQPQQKRITGTVTGKDGIPLPGVNVVVTGTTQGTMTDIAGNYTIEVPQGSRSLTFTFIGMEPQEISFGTLTQINVTMVESAIGLEEVIVVGYGAQKKSDLTGSVSSIKTTDLQKTPMTSIDQGLIGRASGVQVTQTSGMPGAVASIRIRGSSSLQGGNEPLYVIDGFPVYSGTGFGNTGGQTQISGLATVNPDDIESIEILKDASATAIYGARAANGVVLITTKSGKKGYDQITLDYSFGIQKLAKKINLMNAQEYAALVNEAYTNDGLAPFYDAGKLAEIAAIGNGTDWQDKIYRTGTTKNYQLSFSGGDEKTVYAISGNYFNQDGIIINSDFKRYSLRINLDRKINNKFKVGTHLTGGYIDNNAVITDAVSTEAGVVNGALKMNPILPVYTNEETSEYTLINTPGKLNPNPFATAKEQKLNTTTTRLLGDVYAEWEFLPGLKAKVSMGSDIMYLRSNSYIPSSIYQSFGTASGNISVNKSINWLNENILTWNKTINEIHVFNFLAGFTLQNNQIETVSASAGNFVNNVMEYNNLGAGSIYYQPQSSAVNWSLMSYLGRINYSLRNKYLFSINARADGSSRFGANNKIGFFPSGSAAWRISEEDFMQPLSKQISNLKLRISYGFTGNTEIGVYESLATLGSNSWTIGNQLVSGFYPNKIPNPNLKWEKTGQFDMGLDIGIFDNRFRITADYYHKKTTDLLYSTSVPFVSGFETMLMNVGSIENKGFEFSLESDNLNGALKWTTAFNISFNRNKVLELGGESYKEIPGNNILNSGPIRRLIVGQPIGVFYGYRFDGIFQSPEEVATQTSSTSPLGVGFRKYKDLNNDGKVDSNNDREILGDANPDFFGGLTNTFAFKKFELNIFLQYCYGNEIYNFNAIELETPTGGNNVYQDLVNRWKPNAPSNIYPKANTNRTVLISDRFVEDGSYLKLKTISFSYDLPVKNSKIVSGLRIYISGQNLFTLTNYRGYDPEVSYHGASTLEAGEDYGGYPQSKTFMVGVKLDIK